MLLEKKKKRTDTNIYGWTSHDIKDLLMQINSREDAHANFCSPPPNKKKKLPLYTV